MLNIIICTHDDIYLKTLDNKIRLYLTTKQIKYQITHYHFIQDLMNHLPNEQSIILLDNEWIETTGIIVAKKLRQLIKNFILILLDYRVDNVFQAFHVNTFRYILKSQSDAYLFEAIESAINKLYDEQYLTIKFVGYPKKNIKMKHIIYLESDLHKIYFHLTYAQTSKYIYSSWKNIVSQLSTQQFLRIHQSYLINRQYLVDIQYFKAILINDVELPISQKYFNIIQNYWQNM